MPKPPTIGICTPIPKTPVNPKGYMDGSDKRERLGFLTPEWHRARMRLAIPPGHSVAEIYEDGMEIGVARCKAVEDARRGGLKYLFFNDWDTILPADALYKLVYHLENNPQYGVAAGVYCLKSIPPYPMIVKEWGQGWNFDWTIGDIIWDVVGVPMGCTLLRLSLFDDLPTDAKPWFKTVDELLAGSDGDLQAIKATEDFYFCQRYINECAGKILVDGSLLCEHIDHATGYRYCLGEDSLPYKRLKELQEEGRKFAERLMSVS